MRFHVLTLFPFAQLLGPDNLAFVERDARLIPHNSGVMVWTNLKEITRSNGHFLIVGCQNCYSP